MQLLLRIVPVLLSLIVSIRADFDGYNLDELAHMRDLIRHIPGTTTPTNTPTSVTIPYKPTTFDAAVCSAYPELCTNAGILPTA
jgi:hypothetical protein